MQARPRTRRTPINPLLRSDYLLALQQWNLRLDDLQRQVRVLEAVRWPANVEHDFIARGGHELPRVGKHDYQKQHSPAALARSQHELRSLEQDIRRRVNGDDPAARLLLRRVQSCGLALRLVAARGTAGFGRLARDVYGTSLGSPAIRERLLKLIAGLESAPPAPAPAMFDAVAAAAELTRRLRQHFGALPVRVRVVDHLCADACAGGNSLKLRRAACFTRQDIDLLEVHEGWVHLGTTFNGRGQPVFPVLGRAAPGVTPTQEGLAVLAEVLTGTCHAARRVKLALRLRAVLMAEDGANFLEVFRFFKARHLDDHESYRLTARVFRGGRPAGGGPFTKDLSYGLGLIGLADALGSATDAAETAALLFAGKTGLDDLPELRALHARGLLARGEFVPAVFRSHSGLKAALGQLVPS